MPQLPHFARPPLDEVVLGLQFEPAQGYSNVHLGEIWQRFRDEYPIVQEAPRLEPQFELFGGSSTPGFHFNILPPPLRGRTWFVSLDETHLVQFQEDRVLLNWRKRPNVPSPQAEYPRFEAIREKFSQASDRIRVFHQNVLLSPFRVTQAEVSYINMMHVESFSEISNILKHLRIEDFDVEGLSCNFTEVLRDNGGKPFARTYCEVQTMVAGETGQKALRLSLTVRGKPLTSELEDALSFIDSARLQIVNKFCELTSKAAHQTWGRIE